MKNVRPVMPPLVLTALCLALAACTQTPTRSADTAAPRDPAYVSDGGPGPAGGDTPRLTIKSGEGEKLRLPWFIQDAKDWINSGS